jgi:predicted DNA-binding transcriptional regulator YafY
MREGAARFLTPAGFDAARHLETSIKSIPRAHMVRVRCRGALANVQHRLPEGAFFLEEDADGVWLTGNVDDLEWMARVLAGLDVPIQVYAPDALREAVRSHAVRMLESVQVDGASYAINQPVNQQ